MVGFEQDWHRFLHHSESRDFRNEYSDAFAGQSVCVTGAGGDIGSALVRSLCAEKLRSLVLLDSSEHGLFELRRQMQAAYPKAACQYVLGSVGDIQLLQEMFHRFQPQVVFHAAAFKHVELLEYNPFAAINNNVLGTYTLVQAAFANRVSKVLLVSTDKAVNPHSVMGVSKRIAERIALSLSGPVCSVNAIRLGNVIGSRGSVIPIFLEQIQNCLSLSVTHPKASRYFISKQKAVTAILAAGIAACEGMILIPELGAPVLVADLAEFLMRNYSQKCASAIRFTGLRSGEKVTEDLLNQNERKVGFVEGALSLVRTEKLSSLHCDEAVTRLRACVARQDSRELLEILSQIVPEYVPSQVMRDVCFGN